MIVPLVSGSGLRDEGAMVAGVTAGPGAPTLCPSIDALCAAAVQSLHGAALGGAAGCGRACGSMPMGLLELTRPARKWQARLDLTPLRRYISAAHLPQRGEPPIGPSIPGPSPPIPIRSTDCSYSTTRRSPS